MGECGLDYFRDFSPRDLQRRAFALAARARRERSASPCSCTSATRTRISSPSCANTGVTRGVAHCFTAGEKERDAYLELGLHIGITGWINDERRGLHLREVVKGIPGATG